MRACPYCAEQIDDAATTCRYCHSSLTGVPAARPPAASIPPRTSSSKTWIIVVAVVGGMLLLVVPCLIALLLPAVQQAREAARRTQCRNNLRQIGLALHNYHDTFGSFPPAYVADENGRPLYSWRVLILPYLGQQSLYGQFDLSQPWDSRANRLILDQIPPTFRCPSDPNPTRNSTSYVAAFGPNCIFSATTPIGIRDVTDGTSNTIMVGEVTGTAIPWTKPEDVDITVHPTIGSPGGFFSRHVGGAQFLFGDGSVHFISENIDPQTLRDLFLRNDGHMIREF